MSCSLKPGIQPLRHKKSHTDGMSMVKKADVGANNRKKFRNK